MAILVAQEQVAVEKGTEHSLVLQMFDYTIGEKRTSSDFQQVVVGTARILADPIRLHSD